MVKDERLYQTKVGEELAEENVAKVYCSECRYHRTNYGSHLCNHKKWRVPRQEIKRAAIYRPSWRKEWSSEHYSPEKVNARNDCGLFKWSCTMWLLVKARDTYNFIRRR